VKNNLNINEFKIRFQIMLKLERQQTIIRFNSGLVEKTLVSVLIILYLIMLFKEIPINTIMKSVIKKCLLIRQKISNHVTRKAMVFLVV